MALLIVVGIAFDAALALLWATLIVVGVTIGLAGLHWLG